MSAAISDAQEALDAALTAAAAVEGLVDAMEAYDDAVTAAEAADESETEAEAQLSGANATFVGRAAGEAADLAYEIGEAGDYSTLVAVSYDLDGAGEGAAIDVISVEAGEASLTADAEDAIAAESLTAASLTDLLAAVQAAINADEASNDADTAEAEAWADLGLVDTSEAADAADFGGGENGQAVYDYIYTEADVEADGGLTGILETAQDDQTDFEAAVAAWEAAVALSDAYDAVAEASAEALAYIENDAEGDPAGLDTNVADIATEEGGAGNDVFVYTAGGEGSIEDFGAEGTDAIYFGEMPALVALGAEEAITDAVGDVAALEIFWEQDGDNLVLYVEDETFAGNGSTTGDVSTITLVGVDAADITFANGYLSVSEPA